MHRFELIVIIGVQAAKTSLSAAVVQTCVSDRGQHVFGQTLTAERQDLVR